ncbi:MAG: glycosyltransferase [Ignavibacteria bacterium]
MIKVCHIVNIITGKSDGVYKHLKMIFALSDRNKFEHFLIFHGNKKIEDELKAMGIRVYTVNSLDRKFSILTFIKIYSIIIQNNPDIIQTHLIKPYAIAGLLNIFLRKKFIFNYHGIFISGNTYYNFLEKSIYQVLHYLICFFKAVNVVLVPSEKSKKLLKSQTKLFPDPIVYYNGYHCPEAAEFDDKIIKIIRLIKNESIIIAVVGRLERQKRIDRALMLISKMKSEGANIHLLIFGDGRLKAKLKRLASNLGTADSVSFFDFVPNVESYFKYFDILLFTSEFEGLPLTVWEAMANEIPIVAPDVGGFKEIIEENNCGLIFEPENLADAKEKLTVLLRDQGLRKKLAENGKAAVENKYNAKNLIRVIEEIYNSLLNK